MTNGMSATETIVTGEAKKGDTKSRRGKRSWHLPLFGTIPIILFLIVWLIWTAAGGQEEQIFIPTPMEVVGSAWELTRTGTIFSDAFSSLSRVLSGVALAAIVGIPLGILMGASKTWRSILSPTLELLRPIPIAAWVPLTIIVFGIGEAPSLALIFLGALYPILLNTVAGVIQTQPIHRRAALMLGAGRATITRRVLIPSAMPSILTGVRLSLGIGWWVVILAELLAVRSGLGYRMVLAQQQIQTETIVVVMIVIGAIGWGLNEITVRVERKLLRWMPADE